MGAPCCSEGKSELCKELSGLQGFVSLVVITDGNENFALTWQDNTSAHLRLEEGARKGGIPAHDLTRRAHFRAEYRVNAGETREGQNRFFHGEPRHVVIRERHLIRHRLRAGDRIRRICTALGKVGKWLTCHKTRGDRCDGAVSGFGDEWYRTRGAWVDFDQVDFIVFDRELHVHQANNVEGQRESMCLLFNPFDYIFRKRIGRQ